jgi:hypothetical protein
MDRVSEKQLKVGAWALSAVVALLAFIAWGQGLNWQFSGLTAYQFFPLFGLLAFSIMWSHYIAAVARMYSGIEKSKLNSYFEITSLLVLLAILIHPGLLAWQLWEDDLGLPPASELNYVGPALKAAVILGMIAWVIFLTYEFRRKFSDKVWWKYVEYASDTAMILIFWHGLRLGHQISGGWFRIVWFFYGITLILSLIYIHTHKAQTSNIAK